MKIRRFRDEDLEPVVALWHAARRRAHWAVVVHRGFTVDDDRGYMTEKILPRNDVWLAERDDRVVGFMAVHPGWVEQLYVAVDAQRSGVGSALIEHAKSLMDDIRLHTFQNNAPARDFYARHGFGEVAFGVSDPPENEPDVLLRWRAVPAGRA